MNQADGGCPKCGAQLLIRGMSSGYCDRCKIHFSCFSGQWEISQPMVCDFCQQDSCCSSNGKNACWEHKDILLRAFWDKCLEQGKR